VLLSARARCLVVPAAYLMHVGIRLLFGANFLGLIVLYAFWVPWERLVAVGGAAWLAGRAFRRATTLTRLPRLRDCGVWV
jgi:hypothetical protein